MFRFPSDCKIIYHVIILNISVIIINITFVSIELTKYFGASEKICLNYLFHLIFINNSSLYSVFYNFSVLEPLPNRRGIA